MLLKCGKLSASEVVHFVFEDPGVVSSEAQWTGQVSSCIAPCSVLDR